VPEERRRLRIKDPEKYNWHPKRLITQLAQIHLCLYRARRDEWVQVGPLPLRMQLPCRLTVWAGPAWAGSG
jgi:hypothetical protein